MSVSLSDQYVLLLEKVVEENRALREQVKQMAENEKTVIGDLHKKIDDLKTANCSQSRPARQTGTSLRVPKMSRNDVRRKLKVLEKAGENEFVRLNESFASEHNTKVFHTLVDELKHEYGGDGKCPWTVLQLRGAFKTYMKSRKVDEKRRENNSHISHLTKCRRQARKREKMGKRIRSLEGKQHWTSERKAKVIEVLRMDYMSSEESEQECLSPHRTINYVVRPLPWQSNELKKIKKRLDRGYNDGLSELMKKRTLPRSVGEPSSRGKPSDCPEWACDQTRTPQSSSSFIRSCDATSTPQPSGSPLFTSSPRVDGELDDVTTFPSTRRAVLQ